MASKSTIQVRILGDAKGLSDALGEADGKVGGFVKGLGGKLAKGAVAAGAVAGVALAKGVGDAFGAQDVEASIAGSLGVSPARAAELGDVAASAYRDAWGGSLEEVGATVTALESSFEGLGTDELEALTGQATALGETFEIGPNAAIQTASELMSSGLASSADEAFDLLTRGLQEMPAGIRDELLAASDEYGDFFADLGLSGDEAFAALTHYAEDGVYGIDKFGDALKELTIRGTDMSTASVDAFEAAGLQADGMADAFLAGGDKARSALQNTAEGLLSIEDPAEQANAAIALFGSPLEDLGTSEIPGFLQGLTEMGAGMGNVEGASARLADTVGGTTSNKLEAFKRQALGGIADFATTYLLPAIESLIGWFETNWPQIQATISTLVTWLQTNAWPIMQQILGFIQTQAAALVGWWQTNWPQISQTIDNVLAAIKVLWDTYGADIVAFITTTFQNIKTIIDGLMKAVRGIIDTITALIRGDWEGVWNGIKTFFSGIWQAIRGLVSQRINEIKTLLRLAWKTIEGVAKAAWNLIRDYIVDPIKSAWDALTETKDGIASTLDTGWDTVMSAAKAAWDLVMGYIVDPISSALETVIGVKNDIVSTIDGMKDSVVETASNLATEFVEFITGIPGALAELPGQLLEFGGNVGQSLIDGIGGVISGIFDTITGPFRDAINAIIGWWNGLSFTLPRIEIPKVEIPFAPDFPGFGWGPKSFGVPKLPTIMHDGGWVGGRPGTEVPAILEAGEFVLSRDHLSQLDGAGAAGGPLIGTYVDNRGDGPSAAMSLIRAQMQLAA